VTPRAKHRPRVQLTPPELAPATLAVEQEAARLFLGHVGDYLAATGWRPLVAGPITIERRERYRWRLVVDFTGAPKAIVLPATSQTVVAPRRPRGRRP
jgi:hypothetical protein